MEFDDSFKGDGGIFGAAIINPAPPAPWSCPKNAQLGFKCTAKLKIPANSAAPPLNLTFELPDGVGAVQTVENCATLKDAPGQSCATLPADRTCRSGQAGRPSSTIAKLPMTDVVLGDLGGGCTFEILIRNGTGRCRR